jgi:hypothetical protein
MSTFAKNKIKEQYRCWPKCNFNRPAGGKLNKFFKDQQQTTIE